MRFFYRFPLFLAFSWSAVSTAQISEGGLPPSFLPENAAAFAAAPAPVVLAAPDAKKLLEDDGLNPERSRFAVPLAPVDIDPARSGDWTVLPNGDRVWRCVLLAPKALGLLLLFDRFHLPAGNRFFAYTPDRQEVLGAYTAQSCLPSGQFLIGVLPGETTVLELHEAAGSKTPADIHLNRLDYVYDPAGVLPGGAPEDFGEALACNINMNCALGQNWQTEKRGVARILMIFSNGAGWCTGSLMANTAGSGEPYFLTAHHCQIIGTTPNFAMWRFDFEYESAGCPNPATEPTRKSVLGCERISFRDETDFLLLKTNPIPANYNVYFNGWNRTPATNALVQNSTFIHHPSGDIKKISRDNDPATIFTQTINWGGQFGISPVNSHWRVVPDEGIYQPGSSGCVLFDQNKRVVGQLHGGNLDPVACVVSGSWFGRFDLSWDQGAGAGSRLREWLDPANTNALTQNGYAQPAPPQAGIGGNIQTHWGAPMPNVLVELSGGATASTRTDAAGNYTFANLAPGLNYTVAPMRDTNDLNGVTTFDLTLINKYVLGLEPLDSPWKIIAADANGSKSVTTIDIVEGRKVILGLNPQFPAVPSWHFLPANTVFPNPANPFSGGLPTGALQYNNLQQNVTDANFKGVKVGDVNNNANAGG
ncbi:MAG: hypothetical protein IPM98_17515 [Lewinellaceae bacterium]|nr:hypothetical protein [Lewinellaceae bacterium]